VKNRTIAFYTHLWHYATGEIQEFPMHILFADDNEDERLLVLHVLEKAGHTVHAVTDGEQLFLALQGGETVDVVITDYNMPKMDGGEVVRRLRLFPEWKELPVIVHTANERKEELEELEMLGAVVVPKSFAHDKTALIDTLKRIKD
jgi:two-component system, chemotaxis family, chemotaxis protein CheY